MKDITEENLGLEVYVNCDLNADSVMLMIAKEFNASIGFLTVQTEWGLISVIENDEFDPIKSRDPEGFVFYKFNLDIEPNSSTPRTELVKAIATLLELFWSSDFKAVAACDFEDELPRNGGYRYEENK